jgi:hypothetical protein
VDKKKRGTKKKRVDVNKFVEKRGIRSPSLARSATQFPIEAFSSFPPPQRTLPWRLETSALLLAMKEAPNPWTVLGTPLARWTLAKLWELAKSRDRESGIWLDVFVALLSPAGAGRKRLDVVTVAKRYEWQENLARLTDLIQSGEIANAIPTPEAFAVAAKAYGTFPHILSPEQQHALSPEPIFGELAILRWLGIELPEEQLLRLPSPTGGAAKAKGEARDRAGHFLVALVDALEKNPDPMTRHLIPGRWDPAWFVLEKWRVKLTPVSVMKKGKRRRVSTAGDVARHRIGRSKATPKK